jgi:hypothetical protein
MKLFSLIANKQFMAGLMVGLIISAAAAITIISIYYPSPDEKNLKGTMGYTPRKGEEGVVRIIEIDHSCQQDHPIVLVHFTNDPSNSLILCRPVNPNTVAVGAHVLVQNIITGDPCNIKNPGGIWVTTNL